MRCLRTILNAARLPVGFQEVEYITGTENEWIDTGYINTENTGLSVTYKQLAFQPNKGFAGNNDISAGTITNVRGYLGTLRSYQILPEYTSIHTIEVNFKNSGYTYYDGELRQWNTGTRTFNKNETIKVFKAGYLQTGNSSKYVYIYNVKITEGQDVVRNLIPCYRKVDGEIGLYDLVNGVFYTNAGTGDFIKGNDISEVVSSIKSRLAYSILPSEYKQLEYIESTGTQYIDTGKKLTFNDVEIKARISFDNIPSTEQHIISNQNSSSFGFVFGMYSSYLFAFSRSANVSEANATSSSFSGRVDLTIDTKYNSSIAKKQIQVNNTLYNEANFNAQINSSDNNIILFRSGETSRSYFTGKLHYLRFYENNVLKFNLIPCYRKSDGEIGLYDRVNDVFYTNAGTGSFTAGGEVDPTIISSNTLKLSTSRLPEIYQEVEYIESTETQYIDTGVSPDNGTGLKVIFSDLTVATRDFNFIGSRLQGSSRFMINYTNGNFGYGWDGYYTTNENINISMKNTVELNFYNNRHFIANGNTLANLSTIAISNMPTIYIFGQHSQTNNLYSYKVYECEITQDDLLICKFIPCYRKSDNEIGLYDAKNGVFYTNAGTGTFIKGNDI